MAGFNSFTAVICRYLSFMKEGWENKLLISDIVPESNLFFAFLVNHLCSQMSLSVLLVSPCLSFSHWTLALAHIFRTNRHVERTKLSRGPLSYTNPFQLKLFFLFFYSLNGIYLRTDLFDSKCQLDLLTLITIHFDVGFGGSHSLIDWKKIIRFSIFKEVSRYKFVSLVNPV